MKNITIYLCIALLGTICLLAQASTITFTDWTVVDTVNDMASGNLGGIAVSFSGYNIDYGVTDDSFTGFSMSLFTPPIANTDLVSFRGAPYTYNYVLTFSAPVKNPVFHFYSLASGLTFSTSNIIRLSGDPDFLVADNIVSGILRDNPKGYDTNGTIQLEGSFETISFTANYFDYSEDGIFMQIGMEFVPEPADINGDCHIDLLDLNEMVQQWLKTPDQLLLTADLNHDDSVNMIDFSILSSKWLTYPCD